MSKFGLSQIPVHPSFRDSSVNNIAIVPLLSRDPSIQTKSSKSFQELFESLRRHHYSTENSQRDLLLVVPNSSLTRPGDWRYSDTPLKSFHWQHGCQRILVHDGRPQLSRRAHDRLLINRDWVDLCPHRRTAAVVGVLNMHDCKNADDLTQAIEELHQWAQRYATPPYQVTAQGGSFDRDAPVERLFIYDSFDIENQEMDLSQSKLGTSILAFPPSDEAHEQMMDLHMNVVISDLTVAIFRDLEGKVKESSEFGLSQKESAPTMRSAISRYISGGASDNIAEEEPVKSSRNLGVNQLAGLVSSESKLARDPNGRNSASRTSSSRELADIAPLSTRSIIPKPGRLPQLMTPMDEETTMLSPGMSPKDAEALRRRDQARREKYTADLCLMAGSPLDAYERYLKTAEVCKTSSPDPLWLAAALVGCAAAHIAMAEAGGYSVDEYLENNFQLPEDIMAKAKEDGAKRQASGGNKQTLPEVVFELCEDALDIFSRSKKLAHLNAELLLMLASYCCNESESHLRCRWGEGDGCYAGETNDLPRWEKTSISKLTFDPLKTEAGDMIAFNTFVRTVNMCNLLGRAVTIGPLDPASRVDVAIRSSQICLEGLKPTYWIGRSDKRVKLSRKAAYFAVCGAEAAALDSNRDAQKLTSDLWTLTTKLYSSTKNTTIDEGDYGWATLRALCYDSLSVLENSPLAIESVEQLLSLLGDLVPIDEGDAVPTLKLEKKEKAMDTSDNVSVPDSQLDDSGTTHGDTQNAVFSQARFFAYSNFLALSPFLAQQSKWASDSPVPCVSIPLSDSPLTSSLISLRSAWPAMNYEMCYTAQQKCLDRLSTLQRAVSARSHLSTGGPSVFGFPDKALPLYVSSSMKFLDAEEFECVRKTQKKQGGAMATFYNPFEAKKSSLAPTARVSEGEERAVAIKFENRLALPMEIREARVEFRGAKDRVKTPALSFKIPPFSADFAVHFPFTVLSSSSVNDSTATDAGTFFEVEGLSLSCFGRNFYISIESMKHSPSMRISDEAPKFGTPYPYQLQPKTSDNGNASLVPRVEAYPCQPLLQVTFAATGAPAKYLSLALADGEVLTTPVFQLKNYRGPTFKGSIERLEVFITGSLSAKLFDSSADVSTDTEETEEEFTQVLLQSENPPPLKIRSLSKALSLKVINDTNDGSEEGCKFALQISTAHNFGRQFQKTAELYLCFRYRGLCNSETEIWRKSMVCVDISYNKGPRISAVSLRPDIASGSFLTSFGSLRRSSKDDEKTVDIKACRTGLDSFSSHCHDHCMVVLTVANETRSVLTVSRPDQQPYGFLSSPLTETQVRPGVSAKIPIYLPRIHRVGQDGEFVDILEEFVRQTSLVWKTHKGSAAGPMKARGRIRIPPLCLADVTSRHPSFISQISQAPCIAAMVFAGKPTTSDASIKVPIGKPMEVSVSFSSSAWVPPDIAKLCSLSIEFKCVGGVGNVGDSDFVWIGKQRRTFNFLASKKDHSMKLIFCKEGRYIVSACASISRKGSIEEESWWSPHAQCVVVEGQEGMAERPESMDSL